MDTTGPAGLEGPYTLAILVLWYTKIMQDFYYQQYVWWACRGIVNLTENQGEQNV